MGILNKLVIVVSTACVAGQWHPWRCAVHTSFNGMARYEKGSGTLLYMKDVSIYTPVQDGDAKETQCVLAGSRDSDDSYPGITYKAQFQCKYRSHSDEPGGTKINKTGDETNYWDACVHSNEGAVDSMQELPSNTQQ
jgi:hypothetical protein